MAFACGCLCYTCGNSVQFLFKHTCKSHVFHALFACGKHVTFRKGNLVLGTAVTMSDRTPDSNDDKYGDNIPATLLRDNLVQPAEEDDSSHIVLYCIVLYYEALY